MGSAGREVADPLAAATEAQVEARRQNAADAKSWRAAEAEGRVLVAVPLAEIAADDLPRDRLDLESATASEAMDELKASIRARGQREPVELYRDGTGRLQIKKGWRRVTALRALHAETGEPRFSTALARIDHEGGAGGRTARIGLYVDMVEENAVREDLTFAEMAQLVIAACDDPRTGFTNHDEALARLYASLHKMKRSNIRQFVRLLATLGETLKWPRSVGRDLGTAVARRLVEDRALGRQLRKALAGADSPTRQNAILKAALKGKPATPRPGPRRLALPGLDAAIAGRRARITLQHEIDGLPEERLAAALTAFRDALRGDSGSA
jgi:ParB family chromosome partitioning protein